MTENTWPDPARPGVPLNPERDGWHWVRRIENNRPFPLEWTNDWNGGRDFCWAIMGSGEPEDVAKNICYLGPVLTPDEASALQKRADQAALGHAREAARADQIEFLHKRDVAALQKRVAELEGALQRIASAGGLFAEPASGQHAREIARAALEGGKDE